MQQCRLSLQLHSSDYTVPLGAEVWLDQQLIFDLDWLQQSQQIEHVFADVEGSHVLRIVLKNKTSDHTQIDLHGNIVKDACLIVEDFKFDEILLEPMILQKATYTHNHNGTTDQIIDKFYGQMGCNGTVSLEFSAPVYVWLLENL